MRFPKMELPQIIQVIRPFEYWNLWWLGAPPFSDTPRLCQDMTRICCWLGHGCQPCPGRLQLLQAVSASLMWIAPWPGSRMCWLPNATGLGCWDGTWWDASGSHEIQIILHEAETWDIVGYYSTNDWWRFSFSNKHAISSWRKSSLTC